MKVTRFNKLMTRDRAFQRRKRWDRDEVNSPYVNKVNNNNSSTSDKGLINLIFRVFVLKHFTPSRAIIPHERKGLLGAKENNKFYSGKGTMKELASGREKMAIGIPFKLVKSVCGREARNRKRDVRGNKGLKWILRLLQVISTVKRWQLFGN